MAATVVRRIVRPVLLGVIRRQGAFATRDPFPHVAEEHAPGDREPAHDLEDVHALPEAELRLVPVLLLPGGTLAHNVHQRTTAVTTRLTAASGSKNFQPRSMS